MDSRHTTASFDYLTCQCFAASAPRAEMSCVVQSHMRTAAACSAFSPYSACICRSKLLWHPSGHLLPNSPRIERCPVCGAGTVLGSRDPRARDAPLPPVRRWQTPGRGAVGQRHGRAVRRRLFHGDPLRRDADRGDKGSVAFKDHIWGGGEASWMRGRTRCLALEVHNIISQRFGYLARHQAAQGQAVKCLTSAMHQRRGRC